MIPSLLGALAIVDSLGKRGTAENQDIPAQKAGEKAVAIRATVDIRYMAGGGLLKIKVIKYEIYNENFDSVEASSPLHI